MEMIIRVLLLIYSVIGLCYAEVMYEHTSVSRKVNKGGYACNSTIKNLGLMKTNEVKNSIRGVCVEAVCGASGTITIYGCPPMDVDYSKGCKVVQHLSRHYPLCCAQVECPKKKQKNANRRLGAFALTDIITEDAAVTREDTPVTVEDTTTD